MGARPRGRARREPLELEVGLYVGSELDARAIERLRRAGFRSIVDLAHEGEPGEVLSPNVEASWAHTFELVHAREAVDRFPRAEQLERVRRLLEELPRPIYLHATGVRRALVFALACIARRHGWDAEEALRRAEALAAERGVGPLDAHLARFLADSLAREGAGGAAPSSAAGS